jgi:preprotein translocase subunit SecE
VAFLNRLKQGFGNFFSFFGESWSELKKVRWPTRKELVSYTIVVIITVLIITIYFWGLDIGISSLVELFI